MQSEGLQPEVPASEQTHQPAWRMGWTHLENWDGEEGAAPRGGTFLTGEEALPTALRWSYQQLQIFNSFCCHPPTSRKARQAMLTTPTGNLPSEQRLLTTLQLLQDLLGAEKCHPVTCAGSPRQPTATPGASVGGESKSQVRVRRCCSPCLIRTGDVSWLNTHYSLKEKLKTEVQPSRTFCEIVPISFNC